MSIGDLANGNGKKPKVDETGMVISNEEMMQRIRSGKAKAIGTTDGLGTPINETVRTAPENPIAGPEEVGFIENFSNRFQIAMDSVQKSMYHKLNVDSENGQGLGAIIEDIAGDQFWDDRIKAQDAEISEEAKRIKQINEDNTPLSLSNFLKKGSDYIQKDLPELIGSSAGLMGASLGAGLAGSLVAGPMGAFVGMAAGASMGRYTESLAEGGDGYDATMQALVEYNKTLPADKKLSKEEMQKRALAASDSIFNKNMALLLLDVPAAMLSFGIGSKMMTNIFRKSALSQMIGETLATNSIASATAGLGSAAAVAGMEGAEEGLQFYIQNQESAKAVDKEYDPSLAELWQNDDFKKSVIGGMVLGSLMHTAGSVGSQIKDRFQGISSEAMAKKLQQDTRIATMYDMLNRGREHELTGWIKSWGDPKNGPLSQGGRVNPEELKAQTEQMLDEMNKAKEAYYSVEHNFNENERKDAFIHAMNQVHNDEEIKKLSAAPGAEDQIKARKVLADSSKNMIKILSDLKKEKNKDKIEELKQEYHDAREANALLVGAFESTYKNASPAGLTILDAKQKMTATAELKKPGVLEEVQAELSGEKKDETKTEERKPETTEGKKTEKPESETEDTTNSDGIDASTAEGAAMFNTDNKIVINTAEEESKIKPTNSVNLNEVKTASEEAKKETPKAEEKKAETPKTEAPKKVIDDSAFEPTKDELAQEALQKVRVKEKAIEHEDGAMTTVKPGEVTKMLGVTDKDLSDFKGTVETGKTKDGKKATVRIEKGLLVQEESITKPDGQTEVKRKGRAIPVHEMKDKNGSRYLVAFEEPSKHSDIDTGDPYMKGVGYLIPVNEKGEIERKGIVNFYAQRNSIGTKLAKGENGKVKGRFLYDDFESIKKDLGLEPMNSKAEVKTEAEAKETFVQKIGTNGKPRYYRVSSEGKRTVMKKAEAEKIGLDKFEKEGAKKAKEETKPVEAPTNHPIFDMAKTYSFNGQPYKYVKTYLNKNKEFVYQFKEDRVNGKNINIPQSKIDQIKEYTDLFSEVESDPLPSMEGKNSFEKHEILSKHLKDSNIIIGKIKNTDTTKPFVELENGETAEIPFLYSNNVKEGQEVSMKLIEPGEGVIVTDGGGAIISESNFENNQWVFRNPKTNEIYNNAIQLINSDGEVVSNVAYYVKSKESEQRANTKKSKIKNQKTSVTSPLETINQHTKKTLLDRATNWVTGIQEQRKALKETGTTTKGVKHQKSDAGSPLDAINNHDGGKLFDNLKPAVKDKVLAVLENAGLLFIKVLRQTANLNKALREFSTKLELGLPEKGLTEKQRKELIKQSKKMIQTFGKEKGELNDEQQLMVNIALSVLSKYAPEELDDNDVNQTLKWSDAAKLEAFQNKIKHIIRSIEGVPFEVTVRSLMDHASSISIQDERNLMEMYLGENSKLNPRIKQGLIDYGVTEANLVAIHAYYKSTVLYSWKYMKNFDHGWLITDSNKSLVDKKVSDVLLTEYFTDDLKEKLRSKKDNNGKQESAYSILATKWRKERRDIATKRLKYFGVKTKNYASLMKEEAYKKAFIDTKLLKSDITYGEILGVIQNVETIFDKKLKDIDAITDESEKLKKKANIERAKAKILSALHEDNNKIYKAKQAIAQEIVDLDAEFMSNITGMPVDMAKELFDKQNDGDYLKKLTEKYNDKIELNNTFYKILRPQEQRFGPKITGAPTGTDALNIKDVEKWIESYSLSNKGRSYADEISIDITRNQNKNDLKSLDFTGTDDSRKDAIRLLSHLENMSRAIMSEEVQNNKRFENNDFVKDHADHVPVMEMFSDVSNPVNDKSVVSDKMTMLDMWAVQLKYFEQAKKNAKGKNRFKMHLGQLGDSSLKAYVEVERKSTEEAKKRAEELGLLKGNEKAFENEIKQIASLLRKLSLKNIIVDSSINELAENFVYNYAVNRHFIDEYYKDLDAFKDKDGNIKMVAVAKRDKTLGSPGIQLVNVKGGIYDLPDTKPGKHNVFIAHDEKETVKIAKILEEGFHEFKDVELTNGFTFHSEAFDKAITKSSGDLLGTNPSGEMEGISKAIYSDNDLEHGRVIIKSNSIVLTKKMAEMSPSLMQIYKMMNRPGKPIHRFTFTSSAKAVGSMGAVEGNKIFNTSIFTSKPNIFEADSSKYLVQQDLTNATVFEESKMPVQVFRYLTNFNSFDKISEIYKEIMEENTIKTEKFFESIGTKEWKSKLLAQLDDSPQNQAVRELLADEAVTRDHPVIKAIEANLLKSIVTKDVFDRISNKTRMIEMPDYKLDSKLKGIRIETVNGKKTIGLPQAMVSSDYKDQLINLNGKKVMFIIRVPTTGMHSVSLVEVVGDFLDPKMKNTIITDRGTQQKAGSDNDGDARYCLTMFKGANLSKKEKLANDVVRYMISEYTKVENFDLLNEPIDTSAVDKAIEAVEAKNGDKKAEKMNIYLYSDMVKMYVNNSESQVGIGHAATFNAFYQFAKKFNFKVKVPITLTDFKTGKDISKSEFKLPSDEKEALAIMSRNANITNIIVDNPNLQKMDPAGLSTSTITPFLTLISLGFDYETVISYFKSPIAQEYIRFMREKESPLYSKEESNEWDHLYREFAGVSEQEAKKAQLDNDAVRQIKHLKNIISVANDVTNLSRIVKANEEAATRFEDFYSVLSGMLKIKDLKIEVPDSFYKDKGSYHTSIAPLIKSMNLVQKYWEKSIYLNPLFGRSKERNGDPHGILSMFEMNSKRSMYGYNTRVKNAQGQETEKFETIKPKEIEAFKQNVNQWIVQRALNITESQKELEAKSLKIYEQYIKGTELGKAFKVVMRKVGKNESRQRLEITSALTSKNVTIDQVQDFREEMKKLPLEVRYDLMKHQAMSFGTSLSTRNGGFMVLFDNESNQILSQKISSITDNLSDLNFIQRFRLFKEFAVANPAILPESKLSIAADGKNETGKLVQRTDEGANDIAKQNLPFAVKIFNADQKTWEIWGIEVAGTNKYVHMSDVNPKADRTLFTVDEQLNYKFESVNKSEKAELASQQKPIDIWHGNGRNASIGPEVQLSNLAYRPFTVYNSILKKDLEYTSVEHAYQTYKSGKFDEKVYNHENWKKGNIYKGSVEADKAKNLTIMKKLMIKSFEQNPDALNTLLNTGNVPFAHTKASDSFWSLKFPQILEEVRAYFKKLKNQFEGQQEKLASSDVELNNFIRERLAKKFPNVQTFSSREHFEEFLAKYHNGEQLDINAVGAAIGSAVFIDETKAFQSTAIHEHAHIYWDSLPADDRTKMKILKFVKEVFPNLTDPAEIEETAIQVIGEKGVLLAQQQLRGTMLERLKGMLQVFWRKVKNAFGLLNGKESIDKILDDIWNEGATRNQKTTIKFQKQTGITGTKTSLIDVEKGFAWLRKTVDMKENVVIKRRFSTEDERIEFESKYKNTILEKTRNGLINGKFDYDYKVAHHYEVNGVSYISASEARRMAQPELYDIPWITKADLDERGYTDKESKLSSDYRAKNIGTPIHKIIEEVIGNGMSIEEAYKQAIENPDAPLMENTSIEVVKDLIDKLNTELFDNLREQGYQFVFEQPLFIKGLWCGTADVIAYGIDPITNGVRGIVIDFKTSDKSILGSKYDSPRGLNKDKSSKKREHQVQTGMYANALGQKQGQFPGLNVTNSCIVGIQYKLENNDEKTKNIKSVNITTDFTDYNDEVKEMVSEMHEGLEEKLMPGQSDVHYVDRATFAKNSGVEDENFIQESIIAFKRVCNLMNKKPSDKSIQEHAEANIGMPGMPTSMEEFAMGMMFWGKTQIDGMDRLEAYEQTGQLKMKEANAVAFEMADPINGAAKAKEFMGRWNRFDKNYREYQKSHIELTKIMVDTDLDTLDYDQLMELYNKVSKMDSVAFNNIAISKLNEAIMRKSAELQMRKEVSKNDLKNTPDIGKYDVKFTALSDFSKEHPVVQSMAKDYYKIMRASQSETKQILEKMNDLGKAVIEDYLKRNGKTDVWNRIKAWANPIIDNQEYFSELWDNEGNMKLSTDASLSTAQKAYLKNLESFNTRRDVAAIMGEKKPKRNSGLHLHEDTFESFMNAKKIGGWSAGVLSALKTFMGANYYVEDIKIPVTTVSGKKLMRLGDYLTYLEGSSDSTYDKAKKMTKAILKAREAKRSGYHLDINGNINASDPLGADEMGSTYKMVNGELRRQYLTDMGSKSIDRNMKIKSQWHFNKPESFKYTKNVHRAATQFVKDMMFEKHLQGFNDDGTIDHSKALFSKILALQGWAQLNNKENTAKMMDLFVDGKILGIKQPSDMGEGKDKFMDLLFSWTFYTTMPFNVPLAGFNVIIGQVNNFINGSSKNALKGNKRYLKDRSKSAAILKHLKVVSVNEDINPYDTVSSHFTKSAMWMIEKGEEYIQGSAFLGAIPDEVYDSIIVDEDEKVTIPKWTKEEEADFVAEQGKKITDIQGKYWEGDKRLYGLFATWRLMGQFKTWLPDTLRLFFKAEETNMYGHKSKGILRTTGGHAVTLFNAARKGTLAPIKEGFKFTIDNWNSDTDPDAVNIRRELKSLCLVGTLLGAYAILHGDTPEEKKRGQLILKLIKQTMVPFDMDTWKSSVSIPSARTIGLITDLITQITTMKEYERSSEWGEKGDVKWIDTAFKLTPYSRVASSIDEYAGLGVLKNPTYGKKH